jgi:hypothetical protein
MRTRPHCWPPEIRSSRFRVAARLVLVLLSGNALIAAGCGSPKAAPTIPSPDVEVASVLQKDVPIFSKRVATLDGYINAQIQPQVAGYVIRQTYKEGSFVRRGQILFQIDPRPFQRHQPGALMTELHGALSSGPRPGFVLPSLGSMDYVTPLRIGSGKTRHLVQCGRRVITRMSLASPWLNRRSNPNVRGQIWDVLAIGAGLAFFSFISRVAP